MWYQPKRCLSMILAGAWLLCCQSPLCLADSQVETVTGNGTTSSPAGDENRVWANPIGQVFSPGGVDSSPAEDQPRTHSEFPLLISFGVHGGYDSNPETTSDGSGSWFTDEQLTLSYDRLRGPLDIKALAGLGVIERFSDSTDIDTFLNLSITYEASRRLTLVGSINAAYSSEPNFSANVGPTQRAGNYFATADELMATYQWSRRFSTVSSYSFSLVRYENHEVAAFTDREEHTLGEEFRLDLLRDTVLLADYRFQVVDYVTNPLDSTTNFVLAGVEHSFNRNLHGQIRGGVSVRSFDQGDSETDPEFEGSLDYALRSQSSINWTTRYGVEQPTVENAASRTTFRTGLQFHYAFTSRLSSAIGFYYEHDDNQGIGPTDGTVGPTGGSFATDAYDVLVGLRYQINRRVDVDLGFDHSESTSADPTQTYSRDRYSLGLNFSF